MGVGSALASEAVSLIESLVFAAAGFVRCLTDSHRSQGHPLLKVLVLKVLGSGKPGAEPSASNNR